MYFYFPMLFLAWCVICPVLILDSIVFTVQFCTICTIFTICTGLPMSDNEQFVQ